GKLRNRGLEGTLDALLASRPGLTWRSGIVFGLERSAVLNLGPHKFLRSGIVSGQGQSDQWAQRILAPDSTGKTYPLGTFYGPVFLGVDPTTGFQVFACSAAPGHTANCVNGLHAPAIYSSRWVESASFLRLQNITVEYALDLPFLTNSARSARLYVSADNLFVITGYSGLDPEVSSLNESDPTDVGLVARGIDYLSYPRPRTFTGGLRVAF